MITLRAIHKSFHRQELLSGADLQINGGDRFALVGPNGAGKSTLFKMILGEVEPDGGKIDLKRGVTRGYLPQENPPLSERTVLGETLADDPMPDGRTTAGAKAVLMGLGFKVSDFERPLRELSGGWAMRVAMARLLVLEPDLLLLDEPTNHLDLESLLWYQAYLQNYPGAIFMISHDRSFINAICGAVVSVQDHTLKVYHGDYEHFLAEREAEKARLESAYRRQKEEIEKMKDFIARNRVRASTASRAQSMIKRLDRLELIELPAEEKTVKIEFPQPQRAGVRVLRLEGVHKAYGDNTVYQGLDFEVERGWRMAFVGHNGAGKSTLLKILAGEIPFDSGQRILGMNVKVGYFSQHRDEKLDQGKTVLQEAMDNDRMNPELMVRTVLGTFLFPGDMVFKKVGVLSGGEKSRLALVKLLLDPPNVLLMDEPTTHLDMASVDALIGALKRFEGSMCCISHDLYFINSLADHVVHVDGGKITVYPGNYDYFQRRQAQQTAGAGLAPAPSIQGEPRQSHGAQARRERALERDKSRKTQRLEAEIEKSHVRLEELASLLADPSLYNDYAKVQEIGDEMHALQEHLQTAEAELSRQKNA